MAAGVSGTTDFTKIGRLPWLQSAPPTIENPRLPLGDLKRVIVFTSLQILKNKTKIVN